MIFDEEREIISDDDMKAAKGEGTAAGGEALHFFYNREERLKRAPQIVRDFYDGKSGRPVKGLFRVLVATRTNRFMLVSVALFAAFVWFYSAFSERKSANFQGAPVALSAFSYEDAVYASLKFGERKPKSNRTFRAKRKERVEDFPQVFPVNVVFSAVDNAGGVSAQEELSGVYEGRELFIRTRFGDYDIIKVKALVRSGGEQKEFSVSVEKR
ncbi:MAG: hypothetical protein ACTTKL_04090 [Treponema sp.]